MPCSFPRACSASPSSLLQELFPQFAGMITDEAYERLALQEVSRLPAFSYAGPILHLGKSAVLLGEYPPPPFADRLLGMWTPYALFSCQRHRARIQQ